MRETTEPLKAELHYSLLSAVFAFVLWGAWAYYISYDKNIGVTSGLVSGLTQGIASFTITLFMVRAVNWIFGTMPDTLMAVLCSALATVSFTGSCLYLTHFLVGTQNILLTIIFPLSVAFVFCLVTANRLRSQHNVHEA